MGLFWATSVKMQQAFLTCGFGGHWWWLRPSQYDVTGIEAKKPVFTVSSLSFFICNMGTTTEDSQLSVYIYPTSTWPSSCFYGPSSWECLYLQNGSVQSIIHILSPTGLPCPHGVPAALG